jgi:hypothetical protein
MGYSLSIDSNNKNPKINLWFQSGKLTDNLDTSKCFSSHKDFRTKEKLESYLRMLDLTYPDITVKVWEIQRGKNKGEWIHNFTIGYDTH